MPDLDESPSSGEYSDSSERDRASDRAWMQPVYQPDELEQQQREIMAAAPDSMSLSPVEVSIPTFASMHRLRMDLHRARSAENATRARLRVAREKHRDSQYVVVTQRASLSIMLKTNNDLRLVVNTCTREIKSLEKTNARLREELAEARAEAAGNRDRKNDRNPETPFPRGMPPEPEHHANNNTFRGARSFVEQTPELEIDSRGPGTPETQHAVDHDMSDDASVAPRQGTKRKADEDLVLDCITVAVPDYIQRRFDGANDEV